MCISDWAVLISDRAVFRASGPSKMHAHGVVHQSHVANRAVVRLKSCHGHARRSTSCRLSTAPASQTAWRWPRRPAWPSAASTRSRSCTSAACPWASSRAASRTRSPAAPLWSSPPPRRGPQVLCCQPPQEHSSCGRSTLCPPGLTILPLLFRPHLLHGGGPTGAISIGKWCTERRSTAHCCILCCGGAGAESSWQNQ